MSQPIFASLLLGLPFAALGAGRANPSAPAGGVDALAPELEALYVDLHQTPELSRHEEKTAARMAERLRRLGFEVTTNVGGHGVVGILRNGKGPTVLLRTELDALPVEEKTGLPYASKVTAKNDAGETVPVMHACGHDVHMTAWAGAAELLAQGKTSWRGTVVFIAQPAEELVAGARAMLDDGLFSRFPKPDFAVAVHDLPSYPAGKVAYVAGPILANVDTVDITIFGRGGHGAFPHQTIDPVVIAARTVLALQTIVAREINPLDPAVVTVGSIHGGTKSNIIPDEVKLKITVRSFKDEVQKRLLSSIARIAKAEAAAAGAPKEPSVSIDKDFARATVNQPELTRRLAQALARALGSENVIEGSPVMGAEDFSEYGRAGVPAVLFWIGSVEPEKFASAKAAGTPLPGLHSPQFAPDRWRTIRTGALALTHSALELLGKP